MNGDSSGLSLKDGWDLSGLTLADLWLNYIAIGGTDSKAQMAAYARGQDFPDSHHHNMIAQAINEHFIGRSEAHHVGYHDIPSLP